MKTIRLLKAEEIDVRVQSYKPGKGAVLLLYKNARVDMDILDETFGMFGWQRKHSRDNANCTVSIYDEDKKQWIDKEDTGTESNTEKEKGQASDSFKRACFNVGIGRELYSSPFIWVNEEDLKIVNGKCYDKFTVEKITYSEDRKIQNLAIKNEKGKRVFVYCTNPKEVK